MGEWDRNMMCMGMGMGMGIEIGGQQSSINIMGEQLLAR